MMTIDDVAEMYLQDIYNNKDNTGFHRPIGSVAVYLDGNNLIEHMQGKKLGSKTDAIIRTKAGSAFSYRKNPENFLELAEWMKG